MRLLLALALLACSNSTAPKSRPPVLAAWSSSLTQGPIPLQVMTLDVRQSRQYTGFVADASVLSFAKTHPGQLYINGDEPDQQCVKPEDYAVLYHDWTQAIKAVDPKARFSPAGFAEPNSSCSGVHSTQYASQFVGAYKTMYGAEPPVSEWRFHDFGLAHEKDVDGWWADVQAEVEWSQDHGAPMVLGSWGFISWDEPIDAYVAHLQRAITLIKREPRIVQAVWWHYDNVGTPHYLIESDGLLTAEGQIYAEESSK